MNNAETSSKFKEKYEQMIQEIEPVEDLIKYFRYSAYGWLNDRIRNGKHSIDVVDACFNEVLEALFDLDIEFSERQEQEIRVTIEELLLNSSTAAEERDDKFVSCEYVIGRKGVVIKVKDEGQGFDYKSELTKGKKNEQGLTDEKVLYGRLDSSYPGGTAMYCLINFANDFQYNQQGNGVVLKFEL